MLSHYELPGHRLDVLHLPENEFHCLSCSVALTVENIIFISLELAHWTLRVACYSCQFGGTYRIEARFYISVSADKNDEFTCNPHLPVDALPLQFA